eukprot:IDg4723t1
MKGIREIRSELLDSIVHNCWRITGIIDGVLRSDLQPATSEVCTANSASVSIADEERN